LRRRWRTYAPVSTRAHSRVRGICAASGDRLRNLVNGELSDCSLRMVAASRTRCSPPCRCTYGEPTRSHHSHRTRTVRRRPATWLRHERTAGRDHHRRFARDRRRLDCGISQAALGGHRLGADDRALRRPADSHVPSDLVSMTKGPWRRSCCGVSARPKLRGGSQWKGGVVPRTARRM
jgi:hypothetical protein